MEHRLIRPLALKEIVTILFEATGIQLSRVPRPRGHAQVVNTGPHVVAAHVVVDPPELPQLLDISPPTVAGLRIRRA